MLAREDRHRSRPIKRDEPKIWVALLLAVVRISL